METKKRREDWLEDRSMTSNVRTGHSEWKKLWRIKEPGLIKQFAQRLARNFVPTESVKYHRNMIDSEVCPICNGATDD